MSDYISESDEDYAADSSPDYNSGDEFDDVNDVSDVSVESEEDHSGEETDSEISSHESSERDGGQSQTNLSLAASRDSLDIVRKRLRRWSI